MLVGQEVHHVSCIEVFSKPEGRYLHVGEEALSHKTNNTKRKTTTAKLGAMMMSDDETKNICHFVILMSSTVERCMVIFGFHTQEFGKVLVQLDMMSTRLPKMSVWKSVNFNSLLSMSTNITLFKCW